MKNILILLLVCTSSLTFAQEVAVLKYGGGGDWYGNPTALPNLVQFCNEQANTSINRETQTVAPGSVDIFNYAFLHMTGHGNVFFSTEEAENLRNYLLSGGFLHIDLSLIHI